LNNTYLNKIETTEFFDKNKSLLKESSINQIKDTFDINFTPTLPIQEVNYDKDNEQLYIKDLNKILDEEKGFI